MSLDQVNLSRREALAALGLLSLSCHTAFAQPSAPPLPKGGIALQMYTLREPAKKDLAGTLKKVRDMGWQYVQWSGMPTLSAEEIRKALDTAGLRAIAVHTTMEPFETDFDENVRFWKTVGAFDIAPGSMMKDCKGSLEDWLKGAKRLCTLGAKFRAAGMRLSYHNHSFEFETFPGDPRCKLDILMESTKPENLKAELDLAWVYFGGADPAAYLRKYKGRCPIIHVKDLVRTATEKRGYQFKPLGQGELKWPEIFPAAREAGVEWYVYEQDAGEGSPFDYVQASYEFLSKQFK